MPIRRPSQGGCRDTRCAMRACMATVERLRYSAFISYSHDDRSWARWLHKRLESYRVPKSLVGHTTPFGIIPRRLYPIFLDRDELATSANLTESVRQKVAQSACLIVVCSLASARSRLVQEEMVCLDVLSGAADGPRDRDRSRSRRAAGKRRGGRHSSVQSRRSAHRSREPVPQRRGLGLEHRTTSRRACWRVGTGLHDDL